MVRSVTMAAVVFASAVALAATPASAAAKSTSAAAKSTSTAKTHHSVAGTLEKVDGQTLTIKTAKGTEDVTLAPSARIHVGSKTMTAADLNHETGARVKVRYTEKSGQKQAQSVAVSPAHTGSQSARADSKPAPKVNRK